MKLVVSVVLVLVVGSVLVGCGNSVPDVELTEAEDTTPLGVEGMALEAREALPPGFPLEIPVVEGDVETAELLGSDADLGPWRFEIASTSAAGDVAEWYMAQFTGRSWEVRHDFAEDGRYEYVLEKGLSAWVTLQVVSDGEGCTIECWAGIGMAAPDEAVPPSAALGQDV